MYLRNRRTSEAILASSYDLRTEVTLMRFFPLHVAELVERASIPASARGPKRSSFRPAYARKDLACYIE